jgi:N-acetylglucosaminyl-diphospho-decaprenol L-rhamnosyltransferase
MLTAIVLVTHNGWEMTKNCISRLQPLIGHDFIVIVADNSSNDGTPEAIRQNFPDVFLIETGMNLGFGFGNNRAIEYLQNKEIPFDSLCLLNNDTLPEQRTLLGLQKSLETWNHKNPHTPVVISPETRNVDGTKQINYYDDISLGTFLLNAFRTEKAAARYLHGLPTPLEENPTLKSVAWTSAVCWIMSRKLWEKSGGFDEKIFMYYEDFDFASRIQAYGALFILDSRYFLIHLGGGSTETSLKQALQHDRSQEYVFKKRWGKRGLLISKLFKYTRSGIRILISLPLIPVSAKARKNFSIHVHLFKDTLCHF